jgi:glycerate kinase
MKDARFFMKILIAIDSFKGSLSSLALARCVEKGIKNILPETQVKKVAIADGGEGTVDALVHGAGGIKKAVEVRGPLGHRHIAEYGIIHKDTAVIEMAAASGLPLVAEEYRNPLNTTSYGTGELIRAALKGGCSKIIMGIGGSATNDGGVGMAQALGISFRDGSGKELGPGGGALEHLSSIDISGMIPGLETCEFIIASDVSNPLCGDQGASVIYGPQKGADPEMVTVLDRNLKHYAEVIKTHCGKEVATMAGAGAAGGLAVPLLAYGSVVLKPGIDIVFQTIEFEKFLEDVDFVITGEGRIDGQSVFGKVPVGVARAAKTKGIPVVAVVGGEGEGVEKVYACGIDAVISIPNGPMTLWEAMENTESLITGAAETVARFISSAFRP